MKTISIPEKSLKLHFPEKLSECDSRQYIEMSELIFRYQSNEIGFDEFCVHSVYKLLKMKPKSSPFGIDDDLKFSNIAFLSEYINNFFDVTDGQQVIKQDYINNPVPEIKILTKKYFGPEDGFRDLTFGEYIDALRIFHDFHATGDIFLLYLLSGILYREKTNIICKIFSSGAKRRKPYLSENLERRAEAFKYAPFGFVYGAFLYFASFQKYLIGSSVLWSGQELDLSILFEAEKKDDIGTGNFPGIGMDSVAFTLAESGTFGTLDQVRSSNFWVVIVRMYELRKNDIERKQKENARNK
ncbi:MAG: hypothetical protein BGO88_04920 [Flavobacterium sp. 38-13]|uniref:hypothetical protein n=2 Tax=Flavobacterium TaxID=237 RepID=UPI00096397CD|nr:hypothetical protein [uncultured Flavobacterium sp.]OJX55559.1 MAG: hypothetical protein BGO88_04920 [Flavobacterium sp. 38-13]